MGRRNCGKEGATARAIPGGTYDDNIDATLRCLAKYDCPFLLRVGGELVTGSDKFSSAAASAQSIEIDGVKASLTAYNIGGNNFFKLRELGASLNFGVNWDNTTSTMLVTSK